MSIPAAFAKVDPVKLAIGAVLVIGVVYFLGRKTIKDTADAVGGAAADIVTGNNAATRGTPYEGTGIFGTLGGAANKAVPILDDIGGWLGRTIYDWTHPEYKP